MIRWCNKLDDVMFSRQFRLCLEDFYYVIIKISSSLEVADLQAINSSGSSVSAAEHDCVFDADPQDVEIMGRLRNVYSETRIASSDNCVKK